MSLPSSEERSGQEEDLFPETLNLEDQFFREGYILGVSDGQKTGRIEGRIFGLEKGFGKALEMGRLGGKGRVWEGRMKLSGLEGKGGRGGVKRIEGNNERLRKHVKRLVTLTDPEGFSLENGEEEVGEFEERVRDAKGKEVIVERILGEGENGGGGGEEEGGGEDVTGGGMKAGQRKGPVRVRRGEKVGVAGKATGEMEDFMGVGRKGVGGGS